ncbi:putative phytanoyl-dioxygenase protein [Coleophoma cylindrospora]|uniref:Putative phytanoyl-dioxygenase protein n=1 Tax=Coleophoma cylindrospora TaxID=1849047 RepID=A0A3D8RG71_9HELO|nr:putative phytanoyl-dioxygenase protein [Coleophoma cylindrospora]
MLATTVRPPPAPIDPSYKPDVEITKLPANSSMERILEVLDRDGGLILENLASEDELDNIAKEIEASAIKEDELPHSAFPQIPSQTRLVSGLVGRSKTVAAICETPVLTKLREEILTDHFSITREGITDQYTIDPLLSISLSFQIGTGAPRQALHRDDSVHGIDHTAPFNLKKASQFACLIAGCQTTKENGATMFVPGSHRWDDTRQPRVDEICFAEMERGSALIFMGSAYHGGGHNSVPNMSRIVHGLFFVRGILRQEENQFLAIPHQKVLQMTPTMQNLLGYKKPDSALGLVNNRDPSMDLAGVFRRLNA